MEDYCSPSLTVKYVYSLAMQRSRPREVAEGLWGLRRPYVHPNLDMLPKGSEPYTLENATLDTIVERACILVWVVPDRQVPNFKHSMLFRRAGRYRTFNLQVCANFPMKPKVVADCMIPELRKSTPSSGAMTYGPGLASLGKRGSRWRQRQAVAPSVAAAACICNLCERLTTSDHSAGSLGLPGSSYGRTGAEAATPYRSTAYYESELTGSG